MFQNEENNTNSDIEHLQKLIEKYEDKNGLKGFFEVLYTSSESQDEMGFVSLEKVKSLMNDYFSSEQLEYFNQKAPKQKYRTNFDIEFQEYSKYRKLKSLFDKLLLEFSDEYVSANLDYDYLLKDLKRSQRVSSNYVEIYISYIESGLVPPPEVLLDIQGKFKEFVDSKGQLEMEVSFFGSKKKNKGGYSSAKFKDSVYEDFDDLWSGYELMNQLDQMPKKYTKKEVANDFIKSRGLATDLDNFIRQFNRYLKVTKRDK